MNGRVRVLLFEMEGESQVLQDAVRAFVSSTAPVAPPVAPLALVPDPEPRPKARLAAPKTAVDCLPAGKPVRGEVQEQCMAAIKLRPFTSMGIHSVVQKKAGKPVSVGSIYSALAALKKKGLIETQRHEESDELVWVLRGLDA